MQNIIWYLIGAVAVVGVGGFAYTQMKAPADTAPAAQETEATTMRELVASNVAQKCTFTSAQNTSGTILVGNGKIRGDFSSSVNGTSMVGHMVVKDNTTYVWMDGMAQGFKNSFEVTADTQAQSQGINPDERVSYDCQPWTPDEAQFSLPSGIEFKSITEMQVQAGAGAMGASCSQCDMIPDANAKAQCKAVLHCQ
jgi:hypothetical protein